MSTDSRLIITAKRIAAEMEASLKINQQETARGLFLGFGIALLIVYESYTGTQGNTMKPQEILKWAQELPNPTESVIVVQ